MDDKKHTVLQILKFIQKEIAFGSYSEDAIEGLEVAKQCLANACAISEEQLHNATEVDLVQAIRLMAPKKIPTVADKKMAENLKNQGNMCLSENLVDDAIECYTKAIELVEDSAVFYSNRAAAYTQLREYEKALGDCRKAIEIDPNYSKAYGRMGLVYSNQGDFARATESYRRALECDPGNESYQQNLQLSQARVAANGASVGPAAGRPPVPPPGAAGAARAGGTTSSQTASSSASFSMPGGFDLASFMNNPAFMNMATQVMSDPNMRTQLSSMMQGFVGPHMAGAAPDASAGTTPAAGPAGATPAPGPNANPAATTPAMDSLLRMGEQLAEQMRASNPELVDQLRTRYNQDDAPHGGGGATGGPAS